MTPDDRSRARLAWDSALSRAGSALDRGAMRVIHQAMGSRSRNRRPPPADARERMMELAAHYRAAEGALFAAPPPAEMTSTELTRRAGAREVLDLAWPSRYRATWPGYQEELARYGANLTARARLYTGGAPGEHRPTVICLHGWGTGQHWIEERAFVVGYLLRIGLDVALFQLPFHADRAPVQARRSGSMFLTSNLVRTNEAFGQSVSDLRQLAGWLRSRGAPTVGALGVSLGGYVTALWAGLDRDIGFAGVFIPAVSMGALWWSHGSGSMEQRRAERAGVTAAQLDEVFEVHAPLGRPPLLPPERLFIVAARGDRITTAAQAETLWRHWNQPTLIWLAGGHVAQAARGEAFRGLRRWLYSLDLAR